MAQPKVLSFQEKLDKNVAEFNTGGRTLIESLLDIAYQHELPMGIEYLNRDARSRPLAPKLCKIEQFRPLLL